MLSLVVNVWRKVGESVVEIERNDYRRLERIK